MTPVHFLYLNTSHVSILSHLSVSSSILTALFPFSPTFSPCFPRVKKNCLVSFTKNNNEENYQCLQQIYPKSSSFQWFSAKSDKTNQFMFIPFKEIMRRTIKGVLGKLPLKIDRRIFVSRNAAKTPIDDNDSFQARKSQMFN